MNEYRAKRILGEMVQADNSLLLLGHYVCWEGGNFITLDDQFSVSELEAIVWWTRNMQVEK